MWGSERQDRLSAGNIVCSNSGFIGRQIWIQIQALGKLLGIDKPQAFFFLICETEMVMLIVGYEDSMTYRR